MRGPDNSLTVNNHGVSLTAGHLAKMVGGTWLRGPVPPDASFTGMAPLDRATASDVSFVSRRRFLPHLDSTSAGAVICDRDVADSTERANVLLVADVMGAVSVILQFFDSRTFAWGVHPTASLGSGVSWRGRVSVQANASVGEGSTLGEDCRIEEGASLGRECRLGNRVVVERGVIVHDRVELGNDVLLQAGAVVGVAGFGFHEQDGAVTRIPHVGGCRLGTGVEVGANSTISRGTVDDTTIGDDTKVDNLVHVAHNVRVGRGCFILAQVGIAGTTHVGDGVQIGGQAGLAGHLDVGDQARIAAQAGVIGNVDAGATVSGYPARSHREVLRQTAVLARLARKQKEKEFSNGQ